MLKNPAVMCRVRKILAIKYNILYKKYKLPVNGIARIFDCIFLSYTANSNTEYMCKV